MATTLTVMPARTATDGASPAGVVATWSGLRALHVVSACEGLVRYVAGELGPRVHVLNIAPPTARPHYRHLVDSEPGWWAVGVADVFGLGQLVLDAMAEPVPALLTPAEASRQIPGMDRWGKLTGRMMTVDGVDHHIRSGLLYPLYSAQTRHVFLFAANVTAEATRRRAVTPTADAELEAREAYAQWMLIRELLPPAIRVNAVGYDVSPGPSADPLPLPALRFPHRRPTPRRCTEALQLAHMAGWLEFVGPAPDGPGGQAYRTRLVDVNDVVAERTVPGEHVLAWLLGMADGRDAAEVGVNNADVIAYREWLG